MMQQGKDRGPTALSRKKESYVIIKTIATQLECHFQGHSQNGNEKADADTPLWLEPPLSLCSRIHSIELLGSKLTNL